MARCVHRKQLLLEPGHQFTTDELTIELLITLSVETLEIIDDNETSVGETISNLLEEREAPAPVGDADEEEVHPITTRLRLR